MNDERPKISILLAVHNGADFLGEAIDSIVVQSYSNWELLVIDNASTDLTKAIAEKYVKKDARIMYYFADQKGKVNAYNLGFVHSKGDYICFFAADDVLTVNSLEERLQGARRKDSNCSTCLLKTFSDNPTHDGLVFPKDQRQPNFSGGSIFFSRLLAEHFFPVPSILPNEDTWASLHLRAFGVNTHIEKILYLYRIHPNNSYGYGLDFEEKRTKFLQRMHGYTLFYETYKDQKNLFVQTYVQHFVKGVELARQKDIFSLAIHRGLSVRDKAIFIFYSSEILYKIRYKYFKFFSGLFN